MYTNRHESASGKGKPFSLLICFSVSGRHLNGENRHHQHEHLVHDVIAERLMRELVFLKRVDLSDFSL